MQNEQTLVGNIDERDGWAAGACPVLFVRSRDERSSGRVTGPAFKLHNMNFVHIENSVCGPVGCCSNTDFFDPLHLPLGAMGVLRMYTIFMSLDPPRQS